VHNCGVQSAPKVQNGAKVYFSRCPTTAPHPPAPKKPWDSRVAPLPSTPEKKKPTCFVASKSAAVFFPPASPQTSFYPFATPRGLSSSTASSSPPPLDIIPVR
jgi:hypothetical protein